MNDSTQLFLSLLTAVISGKADGEVLTEPMSDEDIQAIYDLAKKHDLAHLIGVALERAEPQEQARYNPFFQESFKAAYRYERIRIEQEKILSLFEENKIPYIPLKGAVIRELYREPWHRTSCDIDILIPEERVEEAVAAFVDRLSYTRGTRSKHDVSLKSPSGVHFELHFNIDEVYVDCAEFWADARQTAPESCRYVLSAEMTILAHIAHMAKHFLNGGCGVRPFLDLWLLKEKLTYDPARLSQMLESHGLTKFSKTVFGLTDVWFDGKTPTAAEQMMQRYVLPAGVYGTLSNKISVIRSGKANALSYAFQRIFPSPSLLSEAYPVLTKYPWLLPVCWVRRWIQLISSGKLKQIKTEYNINRRLDAEALQSTDGFLKLLGLKG